MKEKMLIETEYLVESLYKKGLTCKDIGDILSISSQDVFSLLEENFISFRCNDKDIMCVPMHHSEIMRYEDRILTIEMKYWPFLISLGWPSFMTLGHIFACLKQLMFSRLIELESQPSGNKVTFICFISIQIYDHVKDKELHYFLKIRDWKGGLDYVFGKIATEEEMAYYEEKRKTHLGGIWIEPLEEEFSSKEMKSTLSYIIGYIEGLAKTIDLWYHGEEFEKIIDGVNGKYGYSKEKGFYEELPE